jgi:hypothetical protein
LLQLGTLAFHRQRSGNGFTHMAVDLALAQQAAQRPFAATLRVYRWQPAAVSLGYHQSLDEYRFGRLPPSWSGCGLFARPAAARFYTATN